MRVQGSFMCNSKKSCTKASAWEWKRSGRTVWVVGAFSFCLIRCSCFAWLETWPGKSCGYFYDLQMDGRVDACYAPCRRRAFPMPRDDTPRRPKVSGVTMSGHLQSELVWKGPFIVSCKKGPLSWRCLWTTWHRPLGTWWSWGLATGPKDDRTFQLGEIQEPPLRHSWKGWEGKGPAFPTVLAPMGKRFNVSPFTSPLFFLFSSQSSTKSHHDMTTVVDFYGSHFNPLNHSLLNHFCIYNKKRVKLFVVLQTHMHTPLGPLNRCLTQDLLQYSEYRVLRYIPRL